MSLVRGKRAAKGRERAAQRRAARVLHPPEPLEFFLKPVDEKPKTKHKARGPRGFNDV